MLDFVFLKLKGQQTIPQGPAFNFFFFWFLSLVRYVGFIYLLMHFMSGMCLLVAEVMLPKLRQIFSIKF